MLKGSQLIFCILHCDRQRLLSFPKEMTDGILIFRKDKFQLHVQGQLSFVPNFSFTLTVGASISKISHGCHLLRYFLRNPKVSLPECFNNKNLMPPGSRPVHTRWTAKMTLRLLQTPCSKGTLSQMISALNWKDTISHGKPSCVSPAVSLQKG